MKLAVCVSFLLAVANTATAIGTIRSRKAISGLLEKARRLEDNEEDADEDEQEEYGFLQNYQLKFLACKSGQTTMNEDGQYQNTYNVAVFRLCPAEDCDSDLAQGCKSGYGDYVVSLGAYVEAYFESEKENNENDGNDGGFDVMEYSECREYDFDQGDDEEDDNEDRKRKLDEAGWYIGPTCTDDETNVKLELFTDQYCSQVSDTSFYSIAGKDLPYSSGGLIPSGCTYCYGNNGDGEYEVTEYCMELYGNSYGCETEMEYYSDEGKDESQCQYISELTFVEASSARKVAFWIIAIVILVAIAGGIWYTLKGRKPKPASTVSSEGLMM